MKEISVGNKTFQPYLDETTVQQLVKTLANTLTVELKDKCPVFLPVLNGSFIFAADLLRNLDFPLEISFIKIASYKGTASGGEVSELIGANLSELKGKTVVILEDIIETGISIEYVIQKLKESGAAEVKVCTLFFKPECLQKNISIDYIGKSIPNDFIIGYGLDYNGLGRNIKGIYQLKN